MLYITGDTHGELSRIMNINDEGLTKEDYIIVLGDFGFVWENGPRTLENLKQIGSKKFSLVFLDGNHENFTKIKEISSEIEWHGGKAGLLPHGIIHLKRGEIYNINGKIVGVCGGADSIDKMFRTEGVSWWSDETITDDDVLNFKDNLARCGKVDIMLSHDAPASIIPAMRVFSQINGYCSISVSQMKLEEILYLANPAKWYFGHWHMDKQINDQFECLYRSFKEI